MPITFTHKYCVQTVSVGKRHRDAKQTHKRVYYASRHHHPKKYPPPKKQKQNKTKTPIQAQLKLYRIIWYCCLLYYIVFYTDLRFISHLYQKTTDL